MSSLQGKAILVTGAAKRLGRAIALHLAGLGADLALHAHTSAKALEDTADACRKAGAGKVTSHLQDLAKLDELPGFLNECWEAQQGLFGLVNNASLFFPTPWTDLQHGDWEDLMKVNAQAPALLSAALAKSLMEEGKPGRVVNLVDISADQTWSQYGPYAASKAALQYTTKSQAKAWAKENITVNGVSPGAALFPEEMDEKTRRYILGKIPQGRSQSPDDIACTVAFLLTGPDTITGHILPVDGGALLSH